MIRLKQLRQARGLSGQAVCRLALINPSTLSQIESGRLRPYAGQLEKLKVALGYDGDADELLDEVEAGL